MSAIRQGDLLGEEAIKAVNAGIDLLLLTSDATDQDRVHWALVRAAQNSLVDAAELWASADRILSLKSWLAKRAGAAGLQRDRLR